MAIRQVASRRHIQNRPQLLLLQFVEDAVGNTVIWIFIADSNDELLELEKKMYESNPGRNDILLIGSSGFAGQTMMRFP